MPGRRALREGEDSGCVLLPRGSAALPNQHASAGRSCISNGMRIEREGGGLYTHRNQLGYYRLRMAYA